MILAAIALAVLGALQHMGGQVLEHLAMVTSVSAGSGVTVSMDTKADAVPNQFGRASGDTSVEASDAPKATDSLRSARLARVDAVENSTSFDSSTSFDGDHEEAVSEHLSPVSAAGEAQSGYVHAVTMLGALLFAAVSLYLGAGTALRSRVPR